MKISKICVEMNLGRITDVFYCVAVYICDQTNNADHRRNDTLMSIGLVLRGGPELFCRRISSFSLGHEFDSNLDWIPIVSVDRRSRGKSLWCERFRWLLKFARLWEDRGALVSLPDPRSEHAGGIVERVSITNRSCGWRMRTREAVAMRLMSRYFESNWTSILVEGCPLPMTAWAREERLSLTALSTHNLNIDVAILTRTHARASLQNEKRKNEPTLAEAAATAHTAPTTITTRLLCYDVACACVRLVCCSLPLSLSSFSSMCTTHIHSKEASKVTVSCALYVVKETKNILCACVREYETSLSKATHTQRRREIHVDRWWNTPVLSSSIDDDREEREQRRFSFKLTHHRQCLVLPVDYYQVPQTAHSPLIKDHYSMALHHLLEEHDRQSEKNRSSEPAKRDNHPYFVDRCLLMRIQSKMPTNGSIHIHTESS